VRLFVDPVLVALLAVLLLAALPSGALAERAAWVGLLLFSVFVHEAGHAFVARRRGLRVGGIYLHLVPFAHVERGRPKDEALVALAGPGASLGLAALLLVVPGVAEGFDPLEPESWFARPLHWLLGLTALMGLGNLLPALPMDGGRALRAGLRARVGDRPARRALLVLGVLVGLGLAGAGLASDHDAGVWLVVIGAYLVLVAVREARPTPTPPHPAPEPEAEPLS
jgi:Zn-dependent protease